MPFLKSFIAAAALGVAALLTESQTHAGSLGLYESDANGFNTRTYFYDDGTEVTVFDTQFVPALTEAMVQKIRETTDNPITRVIVTHPNPDKFNGLSVLHALGATSIASKATADALSGVHSYKKFFWVEIAKAFTAETYPVLEAVQETFSGDMTIPLKSGETITLFELQNPGVSTTQTVARIDATGDLIVGDLVHYQNHAWLEGGIADGAPKPDLDAWIKAVKELEGLNGSTIHGGRGPSGPVADVIADQTAYLSAMDRLVSDYVSGLGDKAGELKDPETAQGHFNAIQERAEAAFPDRGLSYLIGYGVYGLAQTKLASGG
ncbi:MAG: MBL fold metallo-hydrolase [Pseudomonadota bacterium]